MEKASELETGLIGLGLGVLAAALIAAIYALANFLVAEVLP